MTGATTINGGTYAVSTGTQTLSGNFTLSSGTVNGGTRIDLNGTTLTISGGTFNGSTTTNIGNSSVDTFSMSSGAFNAAGTVTVTATTNAISGGTFDGGSATLDFNGAFTLSGGTFILSSGSNTFASTFTVSGTPTITEGTNTLTFDGTLTVDIPNTDEQRTFYNLTINTTGTVTITSGDTLIVTNTLTLTNGEVDTGTINLQVDDGTESLSHATTFDGGTGVLSITGAGTDSYTLAAAPIMGLTLNAANVTVNGPGSGTTTFEGAVSIQVGTFTVGASTSAVTFSSTFDQSGGTFNGPTSTGIATFTGAATISGGTFTGGAGAVTLSSTFTQSGGTLTGSTGVITVSGSFSLSSGTFNGGTTTTLNGTSTISGGTYETGTNNNFGNAAADTVTFSGGTVSGNSGTLTFTGDATFSGATVNGEDATWDVNGTFTLSGGVFAAPSSSGALRFASTFTHSAGGTFTHNSGTATFDGGSATITPTLTTFSNVTMNSSATKTLGANLDVDGTLTLTAGTLDVSTTVYSIAVGGSWTDTGAGAFTESTGTVTFDGTGTVNANEAFNAVTVNTSGTVTLGANLQLASGTTLTVTAGTLSLAGFNVTGATGVSNSGTIRLRGAETVAWTTNDTDSGTYEYVGDGDGAAENFTLIAFTGADYFNLTINDSNATKDTFVAPASLDIDGAFTLSSSTFNQSTSTMNVAGAFNLASGTTFTKSSNSSTLTLDGAGNLTDSNTTKQDLGAVTMNGSSARTLTTAVTVTNLTINSGSTFVVAGNNLTFSVAGSVSNSGTFRLQGGETLTSINDLDTNSGTVEYVGDGDGSAENFNLIHFTGTDYYNLTINDTNATKDTFLATEALTVAGALTVSSGTYNANSQTTTVTGLATVSGGTYSASTATQTFDGGLTISGGTFTGSSGTVDVNGALTLSSGTLTAPSGTFTVSGNWAQSGGTFTHNAGTLTLDGGNQTISGDTIFNNLSKTAVAPATLTFPSNAATGQTILGTLTLQGSKGNALSLRSSGQGSQWRIDAQGSRSLSYLDVQDSNSVNALLAECITSCVDSGNNTNWVFSIVQAVVQPLASIQSALSSTPLGGTASVLKPFRAPSQGLRIVINEDLQKTTNGDALLQLTGGGDAAFMAISNFPDFRDAFREVYTATKRWTLLAGEGMKTVYVKFYNRAGWSSETISDSIQYIIEESSTGEQPPTIIALPSLPAPAASPLAGGGAQTPSFVDRIKEATRTFLGPFFKPEIVPAIPRISLFLPRVAQRVKEIAGTLLPSLPGQKETLILPRIALSLKGISEIPDLLSSLVTRFLSPEEARLAIPKISPEKFALQKLPLALQGRWEIFPPQPIRNFVFAPLPKDLKRLAQQPPYLNELFNAVGIRRATDLTKLRAASVRLPGLTKVAMAPAKELDSHAPLPIQGIPLAKLTVRQKQNIPQEVVFAKDIRELVDYRSLLSLSDKGVSQQTIRTIARKLMKLVVKPIAPARSVEGLIVLAKNKPTKKSSALPSRAFFDSLFAASAFAQSDLGENVSAHIAENEFVISEFTYTDPDNDGIYTAEIEAPVVDGQYEIVTIITYKDPELGSRVMRLITVVDPEGYVYESMGDKELRISGAIVTLHQFNPATKRYTIWNASEYNQENPQITDVTGKYAFIVSPGTYFISIEAPGYLPYEGKAFAVNEGQGIHTNVELKTRLWWLNIVDVKSLALVLISILLIYNFYRDNIRAGIKRRMSS